MRRIRLAVAVCVALTCSGCILYYVAGDAVVRSEKHLKETGETLPPPDPCAGEPAWVNRTECAKVQRKEVPRD